MTPISARSRRPTSVSVGMLSISRTTSSAGRYGVLPSETTSFGPRTEAVGFCGTT